MGSDVLVDYDADPVIMEIIRNQVPFAVRKGEIWPYLKIPETCWYPKESDDQGGGVLEGDYTDYIVDDLFATNFKYSQFK